MELGARRAVKVGSLLLALILGGGIGCRTMIGLPIGKSVIARVRPADEIRLCAKADRGISAAAAEEYIDGWNRSYPFLGVRFVLARFELGTRSATIYPNDRTVYDWLGPLEAGCDRQFYFATALVGERAWGALSLVGLPVILGYVDDATGTAGMAYVSWHAPAAQILVGMSPRMAVEHEFFHLLGCPHALTRGECYRRIDALRADYQRTTTPDMFPSMAPVWGPAAIRHYTRADINARRGES